MKKDPVRFESLEKKRDFFEATTPRPPASLPLERNATFSRKKKKKKKKGRLRRFPFCAHRRRHIIFKQRYKTAISLEEERARKGRRFEDQTTDEKNSKRRGIVVVDTNDDENARAPTSGRRYVIYRVFMGGSLTFFFQFSPWSVPPSFFTVCFENGTQTCGYGGVAEQERAYFALQFNNGESSDDE